MAARTALPWRRRDHWQVLVLDLRHMIGDWDSSRRRILLTSVGRVLVHGRYRGLVWYRLSQLLPTGLASWCQSRCLRACAAEIHPRAQIAGGLELVHGAGIVVGSEVVAGAGLSLFQGVTLGHGRDRSGMPTLGRRVQVYAGATVLGPITVGDDVVIGAGALVLKDVPSGSTVVGVWK